MDCCNGQNNFSSEVTLMRLGAAKGEEIALNSF